MKEEVVAGQAIWSLDWLLKRRHIDAWMIDEVARSVIDKGKAVVVEGNMIDLFGHRGIIYFYPNYPHKAVVPIDRHIVGNNAHIQIIRYIGRQPNGSAGGLWYGKPDEVGGILRVVESDVGGFVFLKAFAVQIDIPEALLGL